MSWNGVYRNMQLQLQLRVTPLIFANFEFQGSRGAIFTVFWREFSNISRSMSYQIPTPTPTHELMAF